MKPLLCAIPIAVLALVAPPRVLAQCASCACGDPTLTSMGTELPFGGRIRASIDASYRTDAIGDPTIDEARIGELRVAPSFSWAPTSAWNLAVTTPAVFRTVEYPNGARDRLLSPGDVELRARWFVWRDRALGPSHLFALGLALQLPTAPRLDDETGRPLDHRAQVGSGTIIPGVSASYAFFARPWHAYASATLTVPAYEANGMRMGASGSVTFAVQHHFAPAFAARLAIDSRIEAAATAGAQDVRDSGGFVAFATAGVLVSPAEDFVIDARVSIPTVQALHGSHREGVLVGLGAIHDL